MPIDKRIPRVLNPDADNKTIEKTSMLDALNLYSGPETSTAGNSIYDGGDGMLKNIRGNEEISFHEGENPLGQTRLIGSVEDTKTEITYLFMYSTIPYYHGVWAYDKHGKLPGSDPNTIRLIYRSNQFSFPQNGFVKGDVVYTNASKVLLDEDPDIGVEFDKDALIYFTDGVNEPRKINAYRAFLAGGLSIHGANDVYAEADFITACPRVPLTPITFQFDSDESRSVSNFARTAGFKFAYQYVYKDGIESAISPYSDVAFPQSVLSQGSQTYVDHSQFNRCVLTIPSENIAEVKQIRVLAKEGATGGFGVIEEIEDFNDADFQTYNFYNDRISRSVSTNEVNKQFDSVPRNAVSQTAVSNRMTYGNYLDGFDNIKTNATVSAVYKERGEDFKTFDIKVQPSIAPLSPEIGNKTNAKTVGFVLDCSDLPSEISQGTLIDFKLTVAPDRNWHVYDFIDGKSYHQSKYLGPQEQEAESTYYNNANIQTLFHQTDEEAGLEYLTSNGVNVFGQHTKVNDINLWKFDQPTSQLSGLAADFADSINFPPTWLNGQLPASIGTSAGNPLIFQGAPLVFKVKIRSTQSINAGPEFVASALEACFTLRDVGPNLALTNTLNSLGFEIEDEENSFQARPSYSYDLNIQDGDIIEQPYAGTSPGNDDFRNKLISSVKILNYGSGTTVPGTSKVPMGHFIVNKATLKFYCESVEDGGFIYGDPSKKHLRIGIQNVSGVETVTCVHEVAPLGVSAVFNPQLNIAPFSISDVPVSSGWIAIKPDTVQAIISGEDGYSFEDFLSENSIGSLAVNVNYGTIDLIDMAGESVNKNYLLQLGYLDHDDFGIFDPSDGAELVQGVTPKIRYCLMDGEGGPGGGPSRGGNGNAYDDGLNYFQGSVSVQPQIVAEGTYSGSNNYIQTVFYAGSLSLATIGDGSNAPTCLPLIDARLTINSNGTTLGPSYPTPFPNPSNNVALDPLSVNYNLLHSHAEISSVVINVGEGLYEFDRSFKTEANHDFGIVYYDQRGRHGFVNHLDTVFIDGYSSVERGAALYGPAHVRIQIDHDPPEWAHHYKIVYSGNSTVKDFVQYTAGGAFTKNTQEISEANSNIYVSLNYLQGHPVSYVSAFGARTPEGGLNFYKFSPGDKLRVISYGSSTNRQYPYDVEFEVADLVKLGDTENPLWAAGEVPPENTKGDFVILKNNPNAYGFSHSDVFSESDFWDQNVVIELRTPQKERNLDDLIYYEIGKTYAVVVDSDDALIHQNADIEIDKGDVWFRPVAVNVREESNGVFQDIIQTESGGDDILSDSNFVSVLLEATSASDLFRSDNSFIGRPNAIFEDASETVRESTITHSKPSNPESNKHSYSSFNYTTGNFKDLSEIHGGIQYMCAQGDQIVVIQRDKVSLVPVGKNILSDASGNQSLISSAAVLGEAIVYPGFSGCDTDPSSVYDSGEVVYFANKSVSEIYRWSKSGVEVISDKGMRAMFRAMFKAHIAAPNEIRVVGGYDPLKKEYLLTIINVLPRSTEEGILDSIPQPPGEPTTDFEDIEFMSAQQAIDYLTLLAEEEDSSLHPTFGQIREVLNLAQTSNPTGVSSFLADLDDDQFVSNSDFLLYLTILGTSYKSTNSIYDPDDLALSRQEYTPPKPSKMPTFKDTQQAIDYLIDAGHLLAGEFQILRNYIRNEVAFNFDGLGEVNTTDLLVFLTAYTQSSIYSDTAFSEAYPGASISNPQISALDVILYIIDQGDLTIGQYFHLAQHIKVNLRANAEFQAFSNNYEDSIVGSVTASDMLILLSVLLTDNDTAFEYSLNDTAFNNLLPE